MRTDKIPPERIAQMLAAIKLREAAASGSLVLNKEQQAAYNLAMQGKSFCLIGAAGTGKTTVTRIILDGLRKANRDSTLANGTKFLQSGTPGILVLSYTRRAVANIKRGMPLELTGNTLTCHKLLEYAPEYYSVMDETTGQMRETMRFEPHRHASNPLPQGIRTVVFEESSLLSKDLHGEVIAALPCTCQIIYLGDLHQLPPVYGSSILLDKLLTLPVIELTQIYRQAQDSPIINLAHTVKNGRTDWKAPAEKSTIACPADHSKVNFVPWKKYMRAEDALVAMGAFLQRLVSENEYAPEQDIILCPFNKHFGTLELNKYIAQKLGALRNATVHEVIAGYIKHYFAVGDRILYNKDDAVITKIEKNLGFFGRTPQRPSETLDRWGHQAKPAMNLTPSEEEGEDSLDKLLERMAAGETEEESRKEMASHSLFIKLLDTGEEIVLKTAGEVNNTLFAYALTVHKAQGNEWRKVWLLLHHSHAVAMSRELIYTAVTRAKQELTIIFEPTRGIRFSSLEKALRSPRILGDTLQEKLTFLTEKKLLNQTQQTDD